MTTGRNDVIDDDDDHDHDTDEEALDPDLPEYQRLTAMAKFALGINEIPWLSRVGRPLSREDIELAEAYLNALGFPNSYVSAVETWEEAAGFAENPEWNTEWWEAEEQLRAGLVAQASEDIDEVDLTTALNHIAGQAAGIATELVSGAAIDAGYDDEEFVTAAAGAIVAACYAAGLVLAAGVEEDHPFALKFRLLETGRFPLGVIGTTFSLF